jgi:malate dehydrogenase (oxaloacetate-decarboxylating)
MSTTNKKSLELHKKFGGKMEISSKVNLKNSGDLSLAYTPGVAKVCEIISKNSKLAQTYTIKKNTVAVITDGTAVLGLGDIGPLAALPVMEGKCILYKKFANIDAFPICLDTKDTEEIIKTIKLISPVFGAIHLEDISAPRCFEIEKRLQKELSIPVLHDDQHSTAVVVLAALINALKITKRNKSTAKIVVNGAGAAGIGITSLLIAYGFKNIAVLDSQGALYIDRPDLKNEKLKLAKMTGNKIKGDLATLLKNTDVFIGVSKAGLLKPNMVKSMSPQSIIFALANPTPEIMPDIAKKAGAFIYASGRSDFENQINNVLTYPGIFRGALDNRVKIVTQKMLIKAAENLAALIHKPKGNKLLPKLFNKKVVPAISKAISAP